MRSRLKSGAYVFSTYSEKPELALPGVPNSLGRGRTKKTASTEAIEYRMDGAQDAKKEILA